MIAYVTVGADDIVRAKRFYSAFLPALGYGLDEILGDVSTRCPSNLVSLPLCQISTSNHPSMVVRPLLGTVL